MRVWISLIVVLAFTGCNNKTASSPAPAPTPTPLDLSKATVEQMRAAGLTEAKINTMLFSRGERWDRTEFPEGNGKVVSFMVHPKLNDETDKDRVFVVNCSRGNLEMYLLNKTTPAPFVKLQFDDGPTQVKDWRVRATTVGPAFPGDTLHQMLKSKTMKLTVAERVGGPQEVQIPMLDISEQMHAEPVCNL